ncbi:MAG: site-specific integrase, partial [Bifidobacteriaceae bacterium]|nr:site-specific integrase [Bifidobacteriaceae bacterium]
MPRAWVEDTWLARDRSRTDRWGSGSRWRVRWREETAGGPRLRTKRFAKKSDAEELAAKLDNDIRASVYRDPDLGKTLLREVAAEWLATHLRVKEATSVRYERELRMYVLPKFGSRAVGTITRAEVANWVADLHHGRAPARYMIRGTRPPEYQPVGQQRRPLGAASIEHIMAVFGPVMRWALEQGRIDRDPTAGLSLPRPETSEHVYLTHTQVRDLAEAAEQVSGSHQDAVLVYTLAYTGVRINEALAAQIRSLDTTRRQLRITQTWTKGRDSDRKLGAPKSWERRTVPLPGFAATELAGLVKDRPPGEFIFTAKR